jgi:hypothetical protein
MPFTRAIFAALIAISVVLLPVAGMAAFKVKAADLAQMQDSSAAGPMDDCCPPDSNPCKGMDDCLSMAGCPMTSVTLSGVSATVVEFPRLLVGPMPRLVSELPDSLDGSPPFRPPRV